MGGESRKQRKRVPVLPVAGGELTLQAGQVAADHRLMCTINTALKSTGTKGISAFPREPDRVPSSYMWIV